MERGTIYTSSNFYRVAASVLCVTLCPANASRTGLTIYNDSAHSMRVKLGSSASWTSFTAHLPAGALWEVQANGSVQSSGEIIAGCYLGTVTAVWESTEPTDYAMVTELL